MINITTMKTFKHEMLKSQWMEIIKRHSKSGQSIRQWCEENDISKGKFYYWQRVIREEALIKAGTLAVTQRYWVPSNFCRIKQFTPHRQKYLLVGCFLCFCHESIVNSDLN